MITRSWTILATIALTTATARAESPPAADKPTLTLIGGDHLAGSLAPGKEGDVLAWRSSIATEPFRFPLAYIQSAHFGKRESVASEGEFTVELSGGDLVT